MRCQCCNRNLSDYESTLKSMATGKYLDICLSCLEDMDIDYVGNSRNSNDFIDDEEFDDVWGDMELGNE